MLPWGLAIHSRLSPPDATPAASCNASRDFPAPPSPVSNPTRPAGNDSSTSHCLGWGIVCPQVATRNGLAVSIARVSVSSDPRRLVCARATACRKLDGSRSTPRRSAARAARARWWPSSVNRPASTSSASAISSSSACVSASGGSSTPSKTSTWWWPFGVVMRVPLPSAAQPDAGLPNVASRSSRPG